MQVIKDTQVALKSQKNECVEVEKAITVEKVSIKYSDDSTESLSY